MQSKTFFLKLSHFILVEFKIRLCETAALQIPPNMGAYASQKLVMTGRFGITKIGDVGITKIGDIGCFLLPYLCIVIKKAYGNQYLSIL